MPTLSIPDVLKPYTNVSQLDVPIKTLNELPSYLGQHFPDLYNVLFMDRRLNGFVNLYLDKHAITHELANPIELSQTSNLKLVTSISGG